MWWGPALGDIGPSNGPIGGSSSPAWQWLILALGALAALALGRLRRRLMH